MSNYLEEDEREYTDEGQMFSNAITNYYKLMTVVPSASPKPKIDKRSKEARQLDEMRIALFTLICNSELVIEDCTNILKDVETMEAYMSCDAKAAKTVHQNFIVRLERILQGLEPFTVETPALQKRVKEKLLSLSSKK